ncbi:hypothetical protein [Rhizobium halophytocola]|uniref:Uncharacterized protein n=1 Tax=Rhizobium halophytocola TaxID=735519 RepID=A0ABS4DY83_9HYPH|nr:hypothetical protein [Rhizobium halophytocola]MBP1850651.1 hypothetical protein [Rhizobium halophytocola]
MRTLCGLAGALAVAMAGVLLAGPAAAISRYQSKSLNCEQARQTIRSEGAVILRYPSTHVQGMTLYDRYVRDNAQCDPHEFADWVTVPTRDAPKCRVLACKPRPDRDERPFRFFLPHNSL